MIIDKEFDSFEEIKRKCQFSEKRFTTGYQ
jgi:hypothetical protein